MKKEHTRSLRPLHCELNILTRSDGSAMLTQGETAVLVSVNGPIEVKLQNLQVDQASVEVFYRPKSGISNVGDRLREQFIRNSCESALLTALYPRTAISIQLQEMEDRSGLIACSINGACLAMMSSGLGMRFLIAAVHCIIDKEHNLILDPDHQESADAVASLTFAFDGEQHNTVAMFTTGKFTKQQYEKAIAICREASDVIFQFYKEVVAKSACVL